MARQLLLVWDASLKSPFPAEGIFMLSTPQAVPAPINLGKPLDEFVEIGLLLPKNRAAALLKLARDRHETVGQILRRLVDLALVLDDVD
ncbi:MAG TPA: hypothetical protein VGH33_07905 [Isosphaeraceae bacterium]